MDMITGHLPICVLIACISTACYYNSADGDFVFDDAEAIMGNKDLETDSDVWSLWVHDFWGDPIASKTSHKSYRPLTVLTFRWNYWLAGGREPWGFHVVNIALHAVCCLLFYAVAGPITYHSGHGRVTAAVGALLFAAHPVHTESVAAVVGRADLLSAVFFFLALICFARSCGSNHIMCSSKESKDRQPTKLRSIQVLRSNSDMEMERGYGSLLVVLALCCSAISMLCKEQGITSLGIMLVYDLFIILAVPPRLLIDCLFGRIPLSNLVCDRPWKGFIFRQSAIVATTVACLAMRWYVMGGQPPTFQPVDNPASFANSTMTRALSYNYIYAINGWLLLCPQWLCFDWSMGCIPLVESVTDLRCFATILLWVLIGALVYRITCQGPVHVVGPRYSGIIASKQCCLVVVLALTAIPFVPASNLFFRVGFVVAERVLYLPSAGSCILVAMGWRELHCFVSNRSSLRPLRHFVSAGLFLTLLVFVARSAWRSHEWRREETLFMAGADVCPRNAKVHYNIGKLHADAGHAPEALAAYREAVRLHPDYAQAVNNLGNLLKEQGQLQEAHSLLEHAVKADPKFAAAWMNLGIVKADLNLVREAEDCYLEAIRHRRNYPDAWYNLGNLHLKRKMYVNATQAWRNAIGLKSTHAGAWHNLALAQEETNQLQEAKKTLHQGLKILPKSFDLHLTLANVCGKLNEFKESESAFQSAIALTDSGVDKASAWANLGVLYHRTKLWQQAEHAYSMAEKLNPGRTAAKQNLEMLKKSQRS